LNNIKILNIVDEQNGVYRVVLETPEGGARMWITDVDYNRGELKDFGSNAYSYLEKYKSEIERELKKYKKQQPL
jgi:hypothetical protein